MSAASDSHVPDRCDSIRPLLSDFADGMATATESALVEEHIADCASCSSRLAEFRLIRSAVRSALPDMQPPGDLFVRVASATWQRPSLRDRIFGYLRPAPVRIALGTAFAFGVASVVIAPHIGGGGQIPTAAKNKGVSRSSDSAEVATVAAPHSGHSRASHTVAAAGAEGTGAAPSAKPVAAPVAIKPAITDVVPDTQVAEGHTAPVKPVHIAPTAPKEGLPLKHPAITQIAKANIAHKIEQMGTPSTNRQTALVGVTRPTLSGRGISISRALLRPLHNQMVLPTPAPVKIEVPAASATVAEAAGSPEIKHVTAGAVDTTALTATPEETKAFVPRLFSGKLGKAGTDLPSQNTTIQSAADSYHVALSGSAQVIVCSAKMGNGQ